MYNLDQTPRDENYLPHGTCFSYYRNGQLWYTSDYFHGKKHGSFKGYLHDGELGCSGYYNMGQMIGFWFFNERWHLGEYKIGYYLCLI